jgi:type II secretory pathway pseudopilin PulG
MYHVLKDFAGPVATIIASVTAALITLYFASRQTRIAQQQADTAKQQADTAKRQAETAHARLNLDLYDKRFNIYTTALDLYEADMKKELHDIEAAEFPFVRSFRESSFLFESEDGIYDTLNSIKDAQSKISAHERHK